MKHNLRLGLHSGWLTLMLGALMLAHAAIGRADNPKVTMTIENRGMLVMELYQSKAPKTVAHILGLINKKFYDGILFHRVIADFVAQVGDPRTRGLNGSKWADMDANQIQDLMGRGEDGSGQNVPFEDTGYLNEFGTLALALKAPATATGDSQFYINLKHNAHLDGTYCVFGKVVKGMDLVKKIQQGDKIKSFRVGEAKGGNTDDKGKKNGKGTKVKK